MRQTITHPKIGNIVVTTRANQRTVRYTVSANRVLISCPPRELKHIFPLSQERIDWILQSKAKLQAKLHDNTPFVPETTFRTPIRSYRFEHDNCAKNRVLVRTECNEHECVIKYTNNESFTDVNFKQRVEKLIEYHLKRDAQIYIPQRLNELAHAHNFSYNSLKINSAKTRWGSCSSRKNINISCYAMLLSAELIDLILVHELCHTREMNHSERFHNIMRSIFDNYAELQKQIKSKHIATFFVEK